MKKLLYTLVFSLYCLSTTNAQKVYPLPSPLNLHLSSETQPSLSANGRIMLLRADTGEDQTEEIVISYQNSGRWSRPARVPGVNAGKNTFDGQHFLSADGNTILFTSNRYGGIGSNDLWYVEKTASGGWSTPDNFGKPINTTGSEGDAALSPDGRTLYFVKFEGKTSSTGLPCGKIMIAEMKGRNMWGEPKALPAPVNKGCECNPRLLADGKTLTFASERQGGKGGFDQYMSRIDDNGKWSDPKPFTPVNTENDDLYITIPASGQLVYFSAPAKVGTDIAMTMIPEHLKPGRVMLQFGTVTDPDEKPLDARVILTDLKNNDLTIYNNNPDGSYMICLPEKQHFDIAIQANNKKFNWYSSVINTDTLYSYKELHQNIQLEKINPGLTLELKGIDFSSATGKLHENSTHELNRLARLIKDNPERKYKLTVAYKEILSDSIFKEELTEIKQDTIFIEKNAEFLTDSLEEKKYIIKTTFHNDRTGKEAETIHDFLIKKGIKNKILKIKGIGASTNMIDKPREVLLYIE